MRMKIPYIKLFPVISIIIAVLVSNYFYNLSDGFQMQNRTNISKQIIHNKLITINSTDNSLIDNRAIALNKSNQNEKRMSPGELGSPSNGIPTNIQRYINQLSSSPPDEIAGFPINDLSSETTVDIMKGLSVQNLFKVLKSISVDDLSTLLHRLTPDQVNMILNRLPQNQKTDIQSRIKS